MDRPCNFCEEYTERTFYGIPMCRDCETKLWKVLNRMKKSKEEKSNGG